jgi:hypothetical protein
MKSVTDNALSRQRQSAYYFLERYYAVPSASAAGVNSTNIAPMINEIGALSGADPLVG